MSLVSKEKATHFFLLELLIVQEVEQFWVATTARHAIVYARGM